MHRVREEVGIQKESKDHLNIIQRLSSSNKILLFVFSCIICVSDMGRLLGVGILRKTSYLVSGELGMEVKQKVQIPTNEMEHFWNFEQISFRFDYWEVFLCSLDYIES